MHLKQLRIGYVPYSEQLTQPGDRRRFCHYAAKRNLTFEIAKPSETYDLVILTGVADISTWSEYQKGNARIVYDLINSYLAVPGTDARGLLRGLAKFVTRQSRHLQLSYWNAIQRMCTRADAVICTTEEQRQDILPFCSNVHVILDVHTSLVRTVKTDFSTGVIFNFVWEGLAENVRAFAEIGEVLRKINNRHHIALHLITDLEFHPYMAKYGRRNTKDVVRKLLDLDRVYLYEWNELVLSTVSAACDMALIPISLHDPLDFGKPENKLLLFWRMGVPTVVSATPAYQRAMYECNLPMACTTHEEWEATLSQYMVNESARREVGRSGRAFAEQHYSEDRTLARWDKLFASVFDTSVRRTP